MKRLLTTFGALTTLLTSFGQEYLPYFEDSLMPTNKIEIESANYYTSNTFDNSLMDRFIKGGTITPEIKDRAQGRFNRINSFGGEANQSIAFYSASPSLFKDGNYGLTFAIADNHLVSGNIAPGLFNTVMYGNSDFIGDTMNFGFSHFQYLHYQKVGFGIYDKRSGSSIRLNYVAGSKTIQGRLGESWLVSQPEEISIMLSGSGIRSNSFSPYIALQGHGASIDLDYRFQFENKNGNNQVIQLKIGNLGFIAWNDSTYNYQADTSLTYTGFNIRDFINSGEDGKTIDDYNFRDTLGIETERKGIITTIPAEFVLQKLPLRGNVKKLQPILGFKTLLTSDYFPYLFGGVYYEFSEKLGGTTRLSYGGFGGLQWGFNAYFWANDKCSIAIGSHNLIGFISQKAGFGRSLNFNANFKF